MNNRKTKFYQMLAIRNSAASDARTKAAHTVRTASPPDSETNMLGECMRFSAFGCFMRASLVVRDGACAKKAPVSRSLVLLADAIAYLSEAVMFWKLPDSLVPVPVTAAMMARAMPEAIRPYSIGPSSCGSVSSDPR